MAAEGVERAVAAVKNLPKSGGVSVMPPPPQSQMPALEQRAPAAPAVSDSSSNFSSVTPPPHALPSVQLRPSVASLEFDDDLVLPTKRFGLGAVLTTVAVVAVCGVAGYLLLPKTGKAVVLAAGVGGVPIGGAMSVFLDGTKRCDGLPC